jgi:hypothetical protein
MHSVAQFIVQTFAPLANAASAVAHGFAWMACGAGPHGMFAIGAFVVTSTVVALGCGFWAVFERLRSRSHLDRMRMAVRQSQNALLLRDRMIELFDDSAVVFRTRSGAPLSFRDGMQLLQNCLAGPDSRRLAVAMDGLLTHGLPFVIDVRTIGISDVAVRGYRVGTSAVILLNKNAKALVAPKSADALKVSFPQGRASYGPLEPQSVSALVPPKEEQVVREEVRPARLDAPASVGDRANDAFVVFGPDGRLRLYSEDFARQWRLGDGELRGAPHLSRLAARARETVGRDAIWEVVADAVFSPAPERHAGWGSLMRGDGTTVSLNMTRMADGSTRIQFIEGKREGSNVVPFAARARAA